MVNVLELQFISPAERRNQMLALSGILAIFGMPGGWEVVVILAVILLLFGGKKLPELAQGLGKGIKEFKKATNEEVDKEETEDEKNPK